MFTLQKGDYKYVFEYDTPEELEAYLKIIQANHATQEELDNIKSRHANAHKAVAKELEEPRERGDKLNFYDLEVKFITYKKKLEKVGSSTYKAYESTFNKLKDFFKYERISSLEIEDFERFRDYLTSRKLVNKTVNNHMSYVKMFIEWGVDRKLIKENNVKGVENLSENLTKKTKINYTDKEINEILAFDYEQEYKDIFLIATHTGMRVSEIHSLTNESIKQDDETGIYYFDIQKSKTNAGIRKVPIHKDILERVLEIDFPILKGMTDNGAQKAILKELYRLVDKGNTKTFHTFRANFMEKCFRKYPKKDYIYIIQEIVGHSKEDKVSLSVDTYAKGYYIALKKEIVDSVTYS
ncbi:MAG: site-specific integrase [Sulfurospirillum cavolei]|nr:site-specific integrase [Sulfurospirillum cavolei]